MKNTNAKAMVFSEPNKEFDEKSIVIPEGSEGEIVVRITYTTICTSDLHTYTGRRQSPAPCILGHEIIGTIISIDDTITTDYLGNSLKEGDLITWAVYAFNENNPMAEKGIPQKSPNLYKYGHHTLSDTDTLNGGFATHCILRKGTALFKLPENLNAKSLAPLNCTHATIAGAMRLAGNLRDKNVLITGAGMLGLSACAMAKNNGAKNVYCMDINEDRLELSKSFGVNKTLTSNQTEEYFINNDKIDVVIDTTGVPSAMETGLSVLNIGGTAVWVGAVYNQKPTQVNAEMIVRNLITIKGLHNYTPEDLKTAIFFLIENHNTYPFESLVSDEYNLNELTTAFKAANNGKHYRVGIKQ